MCTRGLKVETIGDRGEMGAAGLARDSYMPSAQCPYALSLLLYVHLQIRVTTRCRVKCGLRSREKAAIISERAFGLIPMDN